MFLLLYSTRRPLSELLVVGLVPLSYLVLCCEEESFILRRMSRCVLFWWNCLLILSRICFIW